MKWILIIMLSSTTQGQGYATHIKGFTYDACVAAGVKVKKVNAKAEVICAYEGNEIIGVNKSTKKVRM